MYVSRKLQFAGMLSRVNGLWAQGDKVISGAIVDTIRVREYCVYMKVMWSLLFIVGWIQIIVFSDVTLSSS